MGACVTTATTRMAGRVSRADRLRFTVSCMGKAQALTAGSRLPGHLSAAAWESASASSSGFCPEMYAASCCDTASPRLWNSGMETYCTPL